MTTARTGRRCESLSNPQKMLASPDCLWHQCSIVTNIDLAQCHCETAAGAVQLLGVQEIADYRRHLASDWELVGMKRLRQTFDFADFMQAMVFVNDIAALAEDEGHHPDIAIRHRRVVLELTTHSLSGLSVNDFILARKIEMCC